MSLDEDKNARKEKDTYYTDNNKEDSGEVRPLVVDFSSGAVQGDL